MVRFDAVVLAGGRSRRMRVPDKTRLVVNGISMLEHVLAAVAAADRIIVVGDRRDIGYDVIWTSESPPGAGPALAVAAGLELVTANRVVVVAGDLPLLTPADIGRLVAGLTSDGVAYHDDERRLQWLCSAWRSDGLRRRAPAAGESMRTWLSGLDVTTLPAPVSVMDCDTPEELSRVQRPPSFQSDDE